MTVLTRVRKIARELSLFAVASLSLGIAFSMVDSTFNNFVNEKFAITALQRSFLEFPRELPGFLVVFVSAALWFLCSRRLSVVSMLLGVAGAVLIGFASSTYSIMVVWLFIYSLGQHLFMPLSATIGMELAKEGKTGQRLGQFNAIRNLAAVLGSFFVVLGFKYMGLTFQGTFAIAAAALMISAILLFSMSPQEAKPPKTYLKLHKDYRLYYILAVMSGARKQIFITFAPWVLVKIFEQPTQIMATLFTISGIVGILFQPFLGWAIDRFGERAILASEAVVLIFVCFGYGYAKLLLPEGIAFLVVCFCFLVDQMMISVGMARSTYMKKIAKQPEDVQPALTVAVTIDHIFSIAAAVIGGLIWNAFGFQYVFLLGILLAIINLVVTLQVRIPEQSLSIVGITPKKSSESSPLIG